MPSHMANNAIKSELLAREIISQWNWVELSRLLCADADVMERQREGSVNETRKHEQCERDFQFNQPPPAKFPRSRWCDFAHMHWVKASNSSTIDDALFTGSPKMSFPISNSLLIPCCSGWWNINFPAEAAPTEMVAKYTKRAHKGASCLIKNNIMCACAFEWDEDDDASSNQKFL